jgi:hypothetical protein
MGPHETKKLLYSKGNGTRLKRQPTEWEKIFASYISDKGLMNLEGPQKSLIPKESVTQ